MCLVVCSESGFMFLIPVLGAVLAVSIPGAMQGEDQSPAVGHWQLGGILSPHRHAVFSVKSWEARKGGEVWNKDAGIMLD